jgi:hypothetical protein
MPPSLQRYEGEEKMKVLLIAGALIASTAVASAQYGMNNRNTFGGAYGTGSNTSSHYVAPHFNSGGSYTTGHYQTNPNSTQSDNFSTRGNYNPYSGAYGTRKPRY